MTDKERFMNEALKEVIEDEGYDVVEIEVL